MSYCRWSSMNWNCDVYVYESCNGGWTTHVAARRRIFQPIPELPINWGTDLFGGKWNDEAKDIIYPSKFRKTLSSGYYRFWAFWYKYLHNGTLRIIPFREIGLPHDGETFHDGTSLTCAKRLEYLRDVGYRVPQYAIEALLDE